MAIATSSARTPRLARDRTTHALDRKQTARTRTALLPQPVIDRLRAHALQRTRHERAAVVLDAAPL